MNKSKISIEIFCAPNCNRCGRTVSLVQEVVEALNNELVDWRKVDIVEELDYAVELGIRATPSIVINHQLIFTASPDKQTLKQTITDLL